MSKQVTYKEFFICEIEAITERDGKNGPYLMWKFKADSGESLVGFTDIDIVVGNRTWNWLANLGVVLHVGEYIELRDLVGTACTVFVDEKRTVRLVHKERIKDVKVQVKAINKPEPKVKEESPEQKKVNDTAEDLFN